MKNKNAQVTLFVIISVIIVISIILFFIFRPSIFLGKTTSNPEAFISKCVKDSLEKSEELLFQNNFKTSSNFTNYLLYKSERVPFMCTTQEFYLPCVPQEPGLFSSIQKNLENRLLIDLNECFSKLERDFMLRGYSTSSDNLEVNVTILEDTLSISVNKKLIISKGDTSFSIDELEFILDSPLYNLIKTVQTITNYESTLCEFNIINWMKSIPDPLILRDRTSDGTKIYTLTDKESDNKIKFAIRTCILPAGI